MKFVSSKGRLNTFFNRVLQFRLAAVKPHLFAELAELVLFSPHLPDRFPTVGGGCRDKGGTMNKRLIHVISLMVACGLSVEARASGWGISQQFIRSGRLNPTNGTVTLP